MNRVESRGIAALSVLTLALAGSVVAAPAASASESAPLPEGASEWVSVSYLADGTKLRTESTTSAPVEVGENTFDQASEYTVYVTDADDIRVGDRIVTPLDDSSGGANDGTASVNVWASLNYTRVSGQTVRANSWSARFTRLDPGATFVRGQLVHRNDSVPIASTQTWNSPSSGTTYSFTPSYAGVNTTQGSGVGIFGTANLRWTLGGSTITSYSPTIWPW